MTLKNKFFIQLLFLLFPFLILAQSSNLVLTGIMDFTVPSGGNDGKAIHVTAIDTITDLSLYGIGVANNGGGSDGQEYTFDSILVYPGDDILVARSISAMSSYFDTCITEFDHILQATSSISQNGDDAIELFFNGNVVETFGDIYLDGTGECWEYTDSWAYKSNSGDSTCLGGNWIFGGVDCTDFSNTSYSSNCPYPLCPLPPTSGCTDPFALNYDPLATYNDGSCLYSGCMDPTALNFCSSCNVNDSLSCVYPTCNLVGLMEDFESNNLNTYGWITYAGTESNVVLNSSNAISGSISLQFSGGTANWSNWSNPYSEVGAFSNSTHVSSSIICLDLSGAASTVNLNVLVHPTGNTTSQPLSWYRLKINDTIVSDIFGNTAYTRQYSSSTPLSGSAGVLSAPTTLIYDLSSYSGDSSVSITVESSCKWTDDIVLVDDFSVFNVNPCSYFSLSSTIINPSCNQFNDGSAIVVASNDTLYSDTYSYSWSDGQTGDTATALSSGLYSCIVTGSTYGCVDTIEVLLTDPSPISVSSLIVDASSSTNSDGSVDLTVSGGTPCLPDSSYSFLWSTGDTTEDVSGLMTGPISCTITDCNGCVYSWNGFVYIGVVSGCTDPLAFNFDPTANTDDSSCVYTGCLDSLALNYDPIASIDDSSCVYPHANLFFSEYAEGSSNNKYFEVYNPTTDTVDLSLYAYPNVGNAPSTPGVYEYWNDFDAGAVILPNDVYVVAHPSADATILAEADETFTYLSNGDDGFGLVYGDQTSYQVIDWLGDWNGDPGSGWEVAGVPNATKDHTLVRKCYVTSGDTSWTNAAGTDSLNSQWLVYPQNTWTYLGSHTSPCNGVLGCTDSTALNYDSLATIDDGSCLYPVYGCTDSTALNYDSLAIIDDGSCYYDIFGCTDSTALNYDPLATVDDGTCNYTLQMANLFFSEYAEGSSNNKYFEVYNPTTDTVDLSLYAYPNVGNAPSTPGVYEYWNDFDAGAVILPNDVYVVAHPSADATILAEADETFTYLSNGDDGFGLVYGDQTSYQVIDWLGDWNGDPGSGWEVAGVPNATQNHTLVRKCDVTSGDTSWTNAAGTDSLNSQWIVYPNETWVFLGYHTSPCNNGVLGCTDSTALNYDSLATVNDGSCLYPVYGCTDSTALNYDPLATVDDGSCNYTLQPMANLFFSEYAEGSSNNKYFEVYNPTQDTVDLSQYAYPNVSNAPSTPGVYEYWNDFDAGAVILPNDVYVVAHPSADPIILAEADETFTYLSNGDDGFGLVFGDQTSYQVIDWLGDWNGDPGSGWEVAGVPNATKDHTLVRKCDVTSGDTSWTNSAGTDSLNSQWLVYPQNTWTYLGSHTSPCNGVLGCTDSTALNYDSLATIDDGSCLYPVYGCTDSTALNYDSLATVDDGSCTYCTYGCTDPLAFNYDSLATCDDGSCIPFVYGCTDSTAINYYPGANTDDGSCIYAGCTDPNATNYDPTASVDDGSCTYMNCTDPVPTGLAVNWVTDTKAEITWDNMNDSACMVLKYFVRYREVGTLTWTTKSAGVGNGLCNFGLNTTTKTLQNLTSSTTYEYKMKAFYCGGTSSNYSAPSQFTTADDCPPMTNLTATTFNGNQAKVRFDWDTTGAYVFARVALRVDTAGANWQTAGGFGVYYPTFYVNKFGLQPGESYRAQGRTFCDSNITSYRSWWTSPIFWTQPGSIRMNGGTAINNLDVYPNPTRDIFNVSFVSEEIQTLSIRVMNIVGEVIYEESLEEFVGEYTKQINLGDYSKGVYFLEINDTNGTINKKIILQ